MKFGFIEQYTRTFPVRLMCRVLGVSPGGYYACRSRPESARAIANRRLLKAVQRLHACHQGRYGTLRMHAVLRAEGYREPRPGRTPDAPAWHQCPGPPPLPADHDRQPACDADCAQPAAAGVHRVRLKPGLAGRHRLQCASSRMVRGGYVWNAMRKEERRTPCPLL